ncbi:MAG: acyl carrier protein [Cyclobacteriaceae bacterium]
MNKDEILERLNSIVSSVLNIESIGLQMETKASDVENWDSLRHLIIISTIEDEFDIEISSDDVLDIKNVRDICRLIKKSI